MFYLNISAWFYASVSILIISMCGLAGVAIVPLVKSDAYQEILSFLVALAVGTLAGDALMVNYNSVFALCWILNNMFIASFATRFGSACSRR